MQRKKGFIIHENFYEQLSLLTKAECGSLFLALFDYHREGKLPQGFSPLLTAVFICFRQAMDQDRITYENRCESNLVNAQKGGRPKKETQEKNKKNEKPKKPDMDMDIDMDMGMEMNTDMDMGMGMGMDMGMDMDTDTDMDTDMESMPDRIGNASAFPDALPRSASLSERQIDLLIKEGVPLSYIEERQARAQDYAEIHQKDPADVLRRWWRGDRRSHTPPPKTAPASSVPKSYALDDFFEAAVARGLQIAQVEG